MKKYIALVSFTEEGIKKVKDTGKRAKQCVERALEKGIKVERTYWTTGPYDLIHIFEAPDEETAAAMSFALGSAGNVRTETYRAFDFEEISEVLGTARDLRISEGSVK